VLNRVGLVSVALMAVACSGGGGGDPSIVGANGMPPSANSNTAPTVMTSQVSGQPGARISTTIAVTDADGDTTSMTMVSGPNWLSLTPNGQLSGTPGMEDLGTFDLVVEVSDGEDSTRAAIRVTVTIDPIAHALLTGDHTIIENVGDTTPPLVMLDAISQARSRYNSDIVEIYQLNDDGTLGTESIRRMNYDPFWQDGTLLSATFGKNVPLIEPNVLLYEQHPNQNLALAVIGRTENGRYMVFGLSVFSKRASGSLFDNVNSASVTYKTMFRNAFDWLVDGTDQDGLNVVLAHEKNPAEAREWLTSTYGDAVRYNEVSTCDGLNLDGCITNDTDLLILHR